MRRGGRGFVSFMRLAAAVIVAVAVLTPATAFAATQKAEVLKVVTRSVNGTIWVDGLIRNPTQTALVDVTVVVKRISSTGRTVSVIKVPASCIVFDGLATTSFTLKRTLSSRTPRATRVSVSVYGTPTFRRPIRLAANLVSHGDTGTHRYYNISVTNSYEQTVTGAIVYGESWTYDIARSLNAFQDSFRSTSLSALRIPSGESTRTTINLWAPGAFYRVGVFAEALALRRPGINVQSTEILVANGAPAAIRGTVRSDATLNGVARAKLVYRTSADGTMWSDATTITASDHGVFNVPVTTTSLRFYSLTSPGVAGSVAPCGPVVIRVHPRVVLTTPVVTESDVMTFSVTGSLSAHEGNTDTPVRLLCYRKVADEWLLGLEKTVALDQTTAGTATYEAVVRLPAPGQWRIAAARDADAKHSYTVSPVRSVPVGVTTLSISASRSRVDCATSSTIKGTFLDQHRAPLVGVGVMLETSANGGGSWEWVWTGPTNSAGVVSRSVRPMSTTLYRFRNIGTETRAAATSAAVKIASSSVVKVVTYPTFGRPSYLSGVRLSSGPHKVIFDIESAYAQLGVSVRAHGGTSWRNTGSTLTISRTGTYDFKFTTSRIGMYPATVPVRIW